MTPKCPNAHPLHTRLVSGRYLGTKVKRKRYVGTKVPYPTLFLTSRRILESIRVLPLKLTCESEFVADALEFIKHVWSIVMEPLTSFGMESYDGDNL